MSKPICRRCGTEGIVLAENDLCSTCDNGSGYGHRYETGGSIPINPRLRLYGPCPHCDDDGVVERLLVSDNDNEPVRVLFACGRWFSVTVERS